MEIYANEFDEIATALAQNEEIRLIVEYLIITEPVAGKVIEGEERLQQLRLILSDLVNGHISLAEAYHQVENRLPRTTSQYAENNRVFASGWAERLVRTQLSRFYNQAVLKQLLSQGVTLCYVPHSAAEDASSNCSRTLAGNSQSVQMLYDRLVQAYAQGQFSHVVKIPDHPHCTHVVRPLSE